MKVMHIQQIKH